MDVVELLRQRGRNKLKEVRDWVQVQRIVNELEDAVNVAWSEGTGLEVDIMDRHTGYTDEMWARALAVLANKHEGRMVLTPHAYSVSIYPVEGFEHMVGQLSEEHTRRRNAVTGPGKGKKELILPKRYGRDPSIYREPEEDPDVKLRDAYDREVSTGQRDPLIQVGGTPEGGGGTGAL